MSSKSPLERHNELREKTKEKRETNKDKEFISLSSLNIDVSKGNNTFQYTRKDIEDLVEVEDKLKYLLISGHVEKDSFVHVELLEALNMLSHNISSLVKRISDLSYEVSTVENVYLCHIDNVHKTLSGYGATLHRIKYNSIEEILKEMKQRKYNGEFIEDKMGKKLDIDLREVCSK